MQTPVIALDSAVAALKVDGVIEQNSICVTLQVPDVAHKSVCAAISAVHSFEMQPLRAYPMGRAPRC